MTGTSDVMSPARWRLLTPLPTVVAVVLALVVGSATGSLVGRKHRTFVATAATLLDQPKAIAVAGDSGVVDKLARLRFKYSGILRSDTVLEAVAKSTGVPLDEVADDVVSRADPNSLLLFVGARGSSEKQAKELANALANELVRFVASEQSSNSIAPLLRVEMRVVAPARKATQLTPTARQQLVAGTGMALVTLVLVLGAASVARRRSP